MNLSNLFNQKEETQKIYGVVVGIVTDNHDNEKLGRVKLKFPWRGVNGQSYWARIATLMAGKNRGTYFLPEVEDEVLVAFDRGDINRPYVIGALWNGVDKPPEANTDGRNNIRKIKSRSGHEIILDDSAGTEKITIKDKTEKNSIVIDSAQNSITIESTMQLKIKSQTIEIEAGANMTIKSGAALTIQGAMVKIN